MLVVSANSSRRNRFLPAGSRCAVMCGEQKLEREQGHERIQSKLATTEETNETDGDGAPSENGERGKINVSQERRITLGLGEQRNETQEESKPREKKRCFQSKSEGAVDLHVPPRQRLRNDESKAGQDRDSLVQHAITIQEEQIASGHSGPNTDSNVLAGAGRPSQPVFDRLANIGSVLDFRAQIPNSADSTLRQHLADSSMIAKLLIANRQDSTNLSQLGIYESVHPGRSNIASQIHPTRLDNLPQSLMLSSRAIGSQMIPPIEVGAGPNSLFSRQFPHSTVHQNFGGITAGPLTQKHGAVQPYLTSAHQNPALGLHPFSSPSLRSANMGSLRANLGTRHLMELSMRHLGPETQRLQSLYYASGGFEGAVAKLPSTNLALGARVGGHTIVRPDESQRVSLARANIPNPISSSKVGEVTISNIIHTQKCNERGQIAQYKAGRTAVLYMTRDELCLSRFQCLARQQIELFEATREDAEAGARGRNNPIVLGQVGIRCRYCAPVHPQSRTRGSTYYPTKFDRVYQTAVNMTAIHLCKHCDRIPDIIRSELLRLKDHKSNAGGGKEYWAKGIRLLGVTETPDGLRFEQQLDTARQHQS